MTIKQAQEAIGYLYQHKLGLKNGQAITDETEYNPQKQIITPFLRGKPGIGKSGIVKQIGKDFNVKLSRIIDLRMSQHDSTDIKGIPKVNEVVSHWLPPEFMPIKGSMWDTGEPLILLFDEFNRAGQDELQALFEVVYDYKIGGKELINECFVICAGNIGFEDNTTVTEMDAALAGRFCFLDIDDVHLKDWLKWASENNISNYVTGFLQANPGHIYVQKDDYTVSPRSWHQFSDIISLSDDIESMVKLFGPGVIYSLTAEFLRYIKEKRITGMDVLKNYDKVSDALSKAERADIHNICADIASLIKSKKLKYNNTIFENFDKFFVTHLDDDNRVFVVGQLKEADAKFLDKFVDFKPEYDELDSLFGTAMRFATGVHEIDLEVLKKVDPDKEIAEAIEQEKQKELAEKSGKSGK